MPYSRQTKLSRTTEHGVYFVFVDKQDVVVENSAAEDSLRRDKKQEDNVKKRYIELTAKDLTIIFYPYFVVLL